jgi:Ferritin-like
MMRVKRPAGAARPLAFFSALEGAPAADPVDAALASLREDLQYAIAVEHATIPPYLTAMYSLVEGTNNEIRGLIRSVVIQEMLHMALAANMLSAIGGRPVFTDPAFIPSYPTGLPFDIGDVEVNLAPFSMDVVRTVFMKIEEPEHGAIPFPTAEAALAAGPAYQTIGEFYGVVRKKFEDLARERDIFQPGSSQLAIPQGAFRIDSLPDAIRAIDLIVQEGEGTPQLPLQGRGTELAHYYRFSEIVNGAALVRDPMSPLRYSYTGYPIPYDPSGVIPIVTNAKVADYRADSRAARLARQFNALYSSMLQTLENAYGPAAPDDANIMGLMFELKIVAQRLTSIALPDPAVGEHRYAAPTFEFVPADARAAAVL